MLNGRSRQSSDHGSDDHRSIFYVNFKCRIRAILSIARECWGIRTQAGMLISADGWTTDSNIDVDR